MAQDWSVHALVYFYSVGSDLPWTVLYWRLDLESADMTIYDTEMLKMLTSPKYVGGYRMGEITFNLTKKPLWIHRMGVRLVLGWKWVDA
jgi:hypothetical protein